MKSRKEILKECWDKKYSSPVYEKSHLKINYEDLVLDAMERYAQQILLMHKDLAELAHGDGWVKQLTTTDSWHNPSWLEFKEKHGL